jgi:hypothetical protein
MSERLISIELVGLLPEVYKVCTKCQPLDYLGLARLNYLDEQLAAYPEEILAEQKRLLDLYRRMAEDFAGRVRLAPVALMSFRGLWLSMRHGLKNTPSLVIGGRRILHGQVPYNEIKRVIEGELDQVHFAAR